MSKMEFSPDNGIDDCLGDAFEKVHEIVEREGMTGVDLLLIMEHGVKLINEIHVEGEKAFRKGFEYGECHAEMPKLFDNNLHKVEILNLLYGPLGVENKKALWGQVFFEVILAEIEKSFRHGFQEGELSKKQEMKGSDNE